MEEESLSPALLEACSTLEEDLLQVDRTFDRTKEIRQRVIERMGAGRDDYGYRTR